MNHIATQITSLQEDKEEDQSFSYWNPFLFNGTHMKMLKKGREKPASFQEGYTLQAGNKINSLSENKDTTSLRKSIPY